MSFGPDYERGMRGGGNVGSILFWAVVLIALAVIMGLTLRAAANFMGDNSNDMDKINKSIDYAKYGADYIRSSETYNHHNAGPVIFDNASWTGDICNLEYSYLRNDNITEHVSFNMNEFLWTHPVDNYKEWST